MHRRAILFVLCASCLPAGADEHLPGEVVLHFGRGARSRMAGVLSRLAGRGFWLQRHVGPSTLRLGLPEDLTVQEACRLFEHDTGVEVTPNYLGRGGVFVPNDTHLAEAWHLEQGSDRDIDATAGWEIGRGSEEIVVAVLDTGVDLGHPEFEGRLLPGWNFVSDNDVVEDDHGHGTRVTALLAANADNGWGAAGVDHFCRIVPVKVLNSSNRGSVSDVIQGVRFAMDAGASVISMSLIDYPRTTALAEVLAEARQAGITLIACAGNDGEGDADVSWPGASPDTISVGATTPFDERAFFSGTGGALDLVAPGQSLRTARLGSREDIVAFFSGCSAATPVAAGIASVVLGLRPELTHDQVRELLVAGAEDQVGPPEDDPPGRDDRYGEGRVNLRRTLARALPLFVRADADSNGQVNLADALKIIFILFVDRSPPPCPSAADVNDDGRILLADAVQLIQFLFADGSNPPAPHPDCGLDPTEDLGCAGVTCEDGGP